MTFDDVVKLYKRAEDLGVLNQKILMIQDNGMERYVWFRGFYHDVNGKPEVTFSLHSASYRCEAAPVSHFPDLLVD